ncbi:CU044_2847 family protein [Leptothermofonsia sp. ETS-13]|uniref:CU044_2847 family protein n=1 Tax=Leptothermofonsia sp. ETS-13 TaxID=3035696 RepID=UPI003BA21585
MDGVTEGRSPLRGLPPELKQPFWGMMAVTRLAGNSLTKLIPVQLEDGAVLYIEAQEEAETASIASQPPFAENGEQRRSGAKGIGVPTQINPAQSMQMVQSTIRTYTVYCLNAFKNLGSANVDEVTLEFGVNVSADAGIPYIASGKAQSNLKLTVKCSFNQPAPVVHD